MPVLLWRDSIHTLVYAAANCQEKVNVGSTSRNEYDAKMQLE